MTGHWRGGSAVDHATLLDVFYSESDWNSFVESVLRPAILMWRHWFFAAVQGNFLSGYLQRMHHLMHCNKLCESSVLEQSPSMNFRFLIPFHPYTCCVYPMTIHCAMWIAQKEMSQFPKQLQHVATSCYFIPNIFPPHYSFIIILKFIRNSSYFYIHVCWLGNVIIIRRSR